MSKKGLGRGLGALIPEVPTVDERDREQIREVEVRLIAPNPKQPRKVFDKERLEELAASIREHGIVQPIVVRPKDKGFEIVAGERRWRAAQLAGLEKVPALVREFSEAETMEIALIENLQRQDLNPMEEAEAYKVLLEEFKLTQEELARRLGKSRPQISNTLRLLQLAPAARSAVQVGKLSMGHAKVLLGVTDAAAQGVLVERVLTNGLSVRDLEAAVVKLHEEKVSPPAKPGKLPLSPDLRAVEQQLRELFGTPVKLSVVENKGKVEITFFGDEGLSRILDVIGIGKGEEGAPVTRRAERGFTV